MPDVTTLVWRRRTCADPNRPPGHRIAQGRNGNRLVEFADGHRVVAPLYATALGPADHETREDQ